MGKLQVFFFIRVRVLGSGLYTPPNFSPAMITAQSLPRISVNKGTVKITHPTHQSYHYLRFPWLNQHHHLLHHPHHILQFVIAISIGCNRIFSMKFMKSQLKTMHQIIFGEIKQLRAHLFQEKVIIPSYYEQYRRNSNVPLPSYWP